jgi:hypothetical protein
MPREIPYEMQTLEHPNPVVRYAHRARYRNSLDLAKRLLPHNGTILDFGAGQGEFLHRLAGIRPDVRRIAIEPYMKPKYLGIATHHTMEAVETESIDLVCSFETLEHTSEQQIDYFISETKRVCCYDAHVAVSVPIMQGLILPIKELSRSILFRRLSDYNTNELIKGIIGLRVKRAENILWSHKGFDPRLLYERLSTEFNSLDTFYSPIRQLPWWCNSQAFFVFRVKKR